jgi:hypothetical protein
MASSMGWVTIPQDMLNSVSEATAPASVPRLRARIVAICESLRSGCYRKGLPAGSPL